MVRFAGFEKRFSKSLNLRNLAELQNIKNIYKKIIRPNIINEIQTRGCCNKKLIRTSSYCCVLHCVGENALCHLLRLETSVFAMLPGLVMTNIAIEHGHLVR